MSDPLDLLDRFAADDRWTSSVIRDLLIHARRPDVISLAGGLPAEELLPLERCAVAAERVLTERGAVALQYGLSAGEPELRELLTRSAQPDPERIVVTAGSQQALDLVARIASLPGESAGVVAIEDPGYLGAVQILRSHRYELVGIPVDADGLVVDVLAERIRAGLRPRLCYVNPTFQNPTGATLSAERAAQLVALAEANDFLVVADDPYVELSLEGRIPPGLPDSPNVVRLGSTSKVVSPGLRIGWLDADPRFAARMVLAKQAADLHTSTFNQLLVTDIMSDPVWWTHHLDALRDRYRTRRSALAEAVATHLPDAVVTRQDGGFFLWAELGTPVADLLPVALDHGVAFVPGSAFAIDTPAPNAVRLSYSSGDPSVFGEAVARLAAALAVTSGSTS